MVITHELEAKTDDNKRWPLTFNNSLASLNLRVDVPMSERCVENETVKMTAIEMHEVIYHDRIPNQLPKLTGMASR